MVTKLRNSRKAGAFLALLLVAACSFAVTWASLDVRKTETATQYEGFDFGSPEMGAVFCEGNYVLCGAVLGGRQISETEIRDAIGDYGRSSGVGFGLLRKYVDCGIFDNEGRELEQGKPSEEGAPAGNNGQSLEEGESAGNNGQSVEGSAPAEWNGQPSEGSTSEEENASAEGSILAKNMQLLGEETDYYVRIQFLFSGEGSYLGVRVDGTGFTPLEQYRIQSNYSQTAYETYAYWNEMSDFLRIIIPKGGEEGFRVIYGLAEENYLEVLSMADVLNIPVDVIESAPHFEEIALLCMAMLFVGAFLLQYLWRGIFTGGLFHIPFEIVVFVLSCLVGLLYVLQDFMLGFEGLTLFGIPVRGAICFGIWFVYLLAVFWMVACISSVVTMKGAYFRQRTLTGATLHWLSQKSPFINDVVIGRGKKLVQKGWGLLKKLYDSLVHVDLTDQSYKTALKIVLPNAAAIFLIGLFGEEDAFRNAIIYSVILFLLISRYMKSIRDRYQVILNATNELAEGRLDTPIVGDAGMFAPVQTELRKIQAGFKKAVDEEVKNERMKTELITNVSHDLRTPLTAIITYIDLLKSEEEEEKRNEYISVLEKKSLRLKVLIEDLFEVSKAVSKNVTMNFMNVDVVDLLKQAGMENDRKLMEAKVELRWKLPDHKVIMWLDGQKTYRVFENLIVNIAKYAMPNTRAYIELTDKVDSVHISMKNVSAEELNFNTDEITERFTRGDSSRNTEGSGLGLAIVKSFVELQQGTLKISTEADLFRADLELPKRLGTQ